MAVAEPHAAATPARRPRAEVLIRLVGGLLWVLCCPALLAAGPEQGSGPSGDRGNDAFRASLEHAAAKTVLPARCRECHAAEFDVWRATGHATGFDTLHRTGRAKEIAGKLGLRLIRRGTDAAAPACLGCHYTPVLRRGRLRAGAGVTCESCHGPARDWVAVHSSYGVPEADFQQAARMETAAHRKRRIADSAAAGMRRSAQTYELAATCFGCHTVPNEEIVNRGGHSAGGADFELVAWSERIRHNFLESYRTGDGRTNAERSRASKRVLYVVGRALAAEFALRGVAGATGNDLYFWALRDRVGAALDKLLEIDERVPLPEIRTVIRTVEEAALAPGNRALAAAADAVGAATRAFLATADGAALAALDPLWDPNLEERAPPPRRLTDAGAAPDGAPVLSPNAASEDEAGAEERAAVATQGEPFAIGAGGDAGAASREQLADAIVADRSLPQVPAPEPVVAASPPSEPAVASPPGPAVTHIRPPWRDPPAHDFVGVPCGGCHSAQERWWRGHPHSRAAARLRSRGGRVLEIARAYGVAAGDLDRGTQTCMWCHGTTTSRPSRRVRAGVGCQRCHGAGADYLDPHQTAGYRESVALGMNDLRDPAVQAATCAGCHYITDPGLIEAGHPTGADFDIVSRKAGIVHWGAAFGRPTVPVDPGLLSAAHARVVAARGPVPEPTAALPAQPPRAGSPGVGAGGGEAVVAGANGEAGGPAAPAEPERPEPEMPGERAAASPPGRDDGASVATALDTLRQHLDALSRALGLSSDP